MSDPAAPPPAPSPAEEASSSAFARQRLGVIALSVVVAALTPDLIPPLEAVSSIAFAWSVWLLAWNLPSGWFVGLIGVGGYAVVFYRANLYGETYLQVFYFVTSLQAIWLWARGGPQRPERPVRGLPLPWYPALLVLTVVGTLAMRQLLTHQGDAAPFWDALTTSISLLAHVLLMLRYTQSWHLWVFVDVIYVPLYAWRGLYVTSALYAVLLVMAVGGLRSFQRLQREHEAAGGPTS